MYTITTRNQYSLKEGVKNTPCPLCSENRKPENKKKVTCQWFWDEDPRAGYCNHCNERLYIDLSEWVDENYKVPAQPIKYDHTSKFEKYFNSRGISKNTLTEMRVTEDKKGNIEFNYYIGNILVNRKTRVLGEKAMWLEEGAQRICYNLNSVRGVEDLYLVEGEIDALSLHEAGVKNVVSVPNGASGNLDYIDKTVRLFENVDKIIIAVDNDAAGKSLQDEVVRRFGNEKSFILDFDDCKDANEYLTKYGKEKLAKQAAQYKDTPVEDVIEMDALFDDYETYLKDGLPEGYKIGLPGFDDIFSTYTGQFITVTGAPGSGKSDWVDQMCLGYNNKYGWKIGYVSPENQPYKIHVDKLMRKLSEMKLTEENIGSVEYNKHKKRLKDDFIFINNTKRKTLESVLEKAGELVRRRGLNCLVIDPYNKVRLKSRTGQVNDDTLNYLNQIDEFARTYDVLVILVAHPVKLQKDDKGDYLEPDFYAVKGGGEFFDSSYHGLCVHRPYYRSNFKDPLVQVRVLKCKFAHLGTNNAHVSMNYEHDSGVYREPVKGGLLPWEESSSTEAPKESEDYNEFEL